MTANAFAFISEIPPIIMVSISLDNLTNDALRECGCFGVSILRVDQIAIARRFGSRDRPPMPFRDIQLETVETGAPVLLNSLGWFDCALYDLHEVGDHTVFFGDVKALGISDSAENPLLYYTRSYAEIGAPIQEHGGIRSRINLG